MNVNVRKTQNDRETERGGCLASTCYTPLSVSSLFVRTDCRHCASGVSDDADIPQSSTHEKCCLEEDAGW